MTEDEKKARAREKSRKWREDNRARHREYSRRWQLENPERYRANLRAWYEANTERHKALGRAWRTKNRERNRTLANEDYRRRRVDRNPDSVTYAEILQNDPCSYCGGEGGVIEHIDPVKTGGTSVWTNLTSACQRCNARKRTKPLLFFLLSHPWSMRDGECAVVTDR